MDREHHNNDKDIRNERIIFCFFFKKIYKKKSCKCSVHSGCGLKHNNDAMTQKTKEKS